MIIFFFTAKSLPGKALPLQNRRSTRATSGQDAVNESSCEVK